MKEDTAPFEQHYYKSGRRSMNAVGHHLPNRVVGVLYVNILR